MENKKNGYIKGKGMVLYELLAWSLASKVVVQESVILLFSHSLLHSLCLNAEYDVHKIIIIFANYVAVLGYLKYLGMPF